ncbi:MAG TPA: alkaline phosphatase family protein [Thermodesulfobacteriota bacterium]|nr:alkaline phosphatase family protein [Thermodesulfobacteriota bacterium]
MLFMFLVFMLINRPESAQAYIGPGAGFAFLSSFLILFVTFALAFFYLLSWPLRFILRALLRKGKRVKGEVERVVVIGLDGMDPKLADKFMNEGKLPNFLKLKKEGAFAPLATSYPSISPVAWSSFMTGVDPSYHNIFDFITRDPCTYLPMLSSAEIGKASKILPIGKYMIPLGKPKMKLLRKGQPFWKILGESGVFSSVLRVPITFPPEKFNGVLLSGMCTPDLKGSQGTFSYYTTSESDTRTKTGGVGYQVRLNSDTINTFIHGPENSLVKGGGELKVPLKIKVDKEKNRARIEVSDQSFELEPGVYSPWVRVTFRAGLGIKVHGICRFYINRLSPEFELYVTPLNIDPENPALPISHPFIYSVYLAKLIGSYGTLGLAEDTWALNEGAIDEDAFLKQAYYLYEEREKMFLKALERTPKGLCTCVFDTTDRIQHMFFRCLDEAHPANRGKEVEKYKGVIEDLYMRVDQMLGRVLERIDEKTVVIVMSDHGFTQFKRGVNLNTWFLKNGYLTLKDGKTTSGDWFESVDWEKTKAFSLGLTGVFINRSGREANGIVEEGDELRNLKRELIEKLTGLVDEATGDVAILSVVDTDSAYSGPYTYDAPDLLIGYNAGYRNSWSCATGRVTEQVFEDNTKHWSGDHCVDPKVVPGVLFSNRRINTDKPDIKDVAPTVLKLFGVDIPKYMKGKPLVQPGQDRETLPPVEEKWEEEERVKKVKAG